MLLCRLTCLALLRISFCCARSGVDFVVAEAASSGVTLNAAVVAAATVVAAAASSSRRDGRGNVIRHQTFQGIGGDAVHPSDVSRVAAERSRAIGLQGPSPTYR